MFECVSNLKEKLTLNRYPLSVETKIRFNEQKQEFIVAYGHMENRARNIGIGETLSKAFEELSIAINEPEWSSRKTVRKNISHGKKTALRLDVYHSRSDSEYIIEVSDTETVVEGSGRNISRAFEDLSRNLNT